jgi:hypothetical protein
MKLFAYGDSWTEGVGGNSEEEKTTEIPEERTVIRHKYCWPKQLSELLGCDFQNDGVGAFSNNAIFNALCYKLKNNLIKQEDLVVVMWSSSLRDSLPFFPGDHSFSIWGERYKSKKHLYKYIFDGGNNLNPDYGRIEKDFRDYYITNLFTDTYHDIINQNYILYLQFVLKNLGIRYLFCDAFDIMIRKDIVGEVDKTALIENKNYWGYKEKTFADFLINLKRKDVWEDGNYWTDSTAGKHPSGLGYKMIAEELYRFISDNNLLQQTRIKSSYLI